MGAYPRRTTGRTVTKYSMLDNTAAMNMLANFVFIWLVGLALLLALTNSIVIRTIRTYEE